MGQIDLSQNDLTGTIPESWGNLALLYDIILYSNPKLTGCIPAGILKALAGTSQQNKQRFGEDSGLKYCP